MVIYKLSRINNARAAGDLQAPGSIPRRPNLHPATRPDRAQFGSQTPRPSRPGQRTAAARTRADGGADRPEQEPNDTLCSALAARGLRLPMGHPGLDLQQVLEVRQALTELHDSAQRPPGNAIRDACVVGFRPHFEAVLCLIRHGVLDPNWRVPSRPEGQTMLHAIAFDACAVDESRPGYVTVAERIQTLVSCGTDIHARCLRMKMTALEYAQLRHQSSLIKALRDNGATH